ncbi:class 1 fructose-bisphosphatase [Sphingobacteriales bacterium UPWRP_1]|nr:fructose-bisphosphatase class I [Sphingobacteriales bacterium TSM_CSM]PSJ75715.1 class 1 fructose-bisphosphatase [Sphingobacteriales bacterium UPWRP_1]
MIHHTIKHKVTTLGGFILEEQRAYPWATGELSGLLRDMGFSAKIINRDVNKAGLVDILGATGDNNIYGEEVKKLDIFANKQFLYSLQNNGECAGAASEENDDFIPFPTQPKSSQKYVVCIDPLDGSSNIDVNVSIGTIFGIYQRISRGGECVEADFLQPGHKLVAAGYVIYGSSTMFVYTTGQSVNGFTYDPTIGEFCLSHPDIKIPKQGSIYSVNESYKYRYSQAVNDFIEYCKQPDKETGRPYSSRYVGSMVADFHRNLIKGGIFLYPAMKGHPHGKLRLLFECNPLSFIVETAGGKATDGKERILDLVPEKLHQRTPIYIGSEDMVNKAMEFLNAKEEIATTAGT